MAIRSTGFDGDRGETTIAPEAKAGGGGGKEEGNVFIAPVGRLYAMARVYFTLTDATFDSS